MSEQRAGRDPGCSVVIGAARGIGAATALALARGGPVVAVDTRAEVRNLLSALPAGSRAVVGDASVDATIDETFTAAAATGCAPRALAYLAFHQPPPCPITELNVEEWDRAHQVTVRAGWRAAVGFASIVPDGSPASIVLVGSVQALRASAGDAAYAVAKAGLHALARALAVELGPRGIRCNVVAPGLIAVERNAWRHGDPERAAALAAEVPVRRIGNPDDVAEVVEFLASERAAYVNGACVVVDGGRSISV